MKKHTKLVVAIHDRKVRVKRTGKYKMKFTAVACAIDMRTGALDRSRCVQRTAYTEAAARRAASKAFRQGRGKRR